MFVKVDDQDFSNICLQSKNLVCIAMAGTKTKLFILQLQFNYFYYFFQGTWHTIFQGG